MAPELVLSNNYDQKCDIFSFSIIMFQVLTLKIYEIYTESNENEKNFEFENENEIEEEFIPKEKKKIKINEIMVSELNEKLLIEDTENKNIELNTKNFENDNNNKINENNIEIEKNYEESLNENFKNLNIELKVANDPNFRPKIPIKIIENKKFFEFIELMKKCWLHDPNERPGFNEISLTLQEIKEKLFPKKK
jgi:serine/threonine protein kinase